MNQAIAIESQISFLLTHGSQDHVDWGVTFLVGED
jgi:hypothetical protein